jgi:hypothetical protein
MSKLICLSLVLLVLFSIALCEEKILVAKRAYNYEPELKNSDFRPEQEEDHSYRPQQQHGKEKGYENHEEENHSYRPQQQHGKEKGKESHEEENHSYRPQQQHGKEKGKENHENGYNNENVEEGKQRLKGPKFFRLCTYTSSTCQFSGVPSCYLMENGQCTLLPGSSGDSIITYVIGNDATALYSSGSQTCSATGGNLYMYQQEFGTCFANTNSGVYYKFLPLENVSQA